MPREQEQWARRSHSGESSQPGSGALGAQGDLQHRVIDGVDSPSMGEGVPKLVLPDPSRAPVAGLFVAEAEQEVAATGHHHSIKAGYESLSVFVVEDVE